VYFLFNGAEASESVGTESSTGNGYIYTGRTKRPKQREKEHEKTKGPVLLVQVFQTTNKEESRYVEELLYISCEPPFNRMHPVSPLNHEYLGKLQNAWNALNGKKN